MTSVGRERNHFAALDGHGNLASAKALQRSRLVDPQWHGRGEVALDNCKQPAGSREEFAPADAVSAALQTRRCTGTSSDLLI